MDPVRIAHRLVAPLRAELAKIKDAPKHVWRRQGMETAALRRKAAAQRHVTRSEASKRAWITIHANRELAEAKRIAEATK
jgi:hypothetical protein